MRLSTEQRRRVLEQSHANRIRRRPPPRPRAGLVDLVKPVGTYRQRREPAAPPAHLERESGVTTRRKGELRVAAG